MVFLIEVISFNDKQNWVRNIQQFSKKDVYYFHEYCSLYHLMGDGEPHLAIYKDNKGNQVGYSFIKRPIELDYTEIDTTELFDIITPYGFGGPLTPNPNKVLIKSFRDEFDDYCRQNNIISEFIRFHPLLKNHQNLDGLLDVIYDRDTVYIDLTKSEDEIRGNYHKNHRRNLNKGINLNLEFKVFEGQQAISIVDSFYKLYCETMDKLNATSYYYFSEEYMRKLIIGLSKNSMIAAVFFGGKVVSAALCIYEDGILNYHLGCSDKEYLHLGANIFQFHHIALWGKQKGLQSFHLGGGHVGRDSLFQFKNRFNPEGTLAFYIGKKIHNLEKYNSLVSAWERHYKQKLKDDFFPAYRKQPVANIPVNSK